MDVVKGSIASALSVVLVACTGDDAFVSRGPSGPDGSVPCTGAECVDGGSGGPPPSGSTDSGAPPACSKIKVTTLAGSVEGNANGAGDVATFKRPEGITVDRDTGTLFVADTGNHLIRKVLANGETTTYSTTNESGDWINPRHLHFAAGFLSLFVADSGHDQVYEVHATGPAMTKAGLSSMQASAVQPTTFVLFVAGTTQIGKTPPFNPSALSGGFETGFVDGKGAAARYGKIVDIAFDGADTLLVSDQGNHRIRKVTATAGTNLGDVVTFAGSGEAAHSDGLGTEAKFEGPNGFFLDADRVLYIADGATIRTLTPDGRVSTLVGSTAGFVDSDGCSAKFLNAKAVAKFGNELYVLDVNRIRKVVLD